MSSLIRSWNKTKSFCWMVSNCASVTSNRTQIASDLIRYLKSPVHMWGSAASRCLSESTLANVVDHGHVPLSRGGRGGDQQRQDVIAQCKVYFAFENSICTDYITEKARDVSV